MQTSKIEPTVDHLLERANIVANACNQRLGRPMCRSDIDDLAQETAIAAWRQLADCRDLRRLDGWLYGIARRKLLTALAQRSRLGGAGTEPLPHEAHAPATEPKAVDDTAFVRGLREAVRADGTTIFEILDAHLVEGRPFPEVARQVGMTEAAAKSRFYRALPRLRQRLAGRWADIASPKR